jgi:hypothetical protein
MVVVLGSFIVFVLLFLPFVHVTWTAAAVLRTAAALTAIALYGLFWLTAALVIESRIADGRRGVLALVMLWVSAVVVIPYAIHQTAMAFRPVPAEVTTIEAVRTAPERARTIDAREAMATLLMRHPEYPRPEALADLGRMYLEGAARNEARDALIAAAKDQVDGAASAHHGLVDRLSIASPAVLLQRSLIILAGTDRSRYVDFLRQKADYDGTYGRFFNLRRFALPRSVFSASDYDHIPRMHYQEEHIDTVLRRIATSLGWLTAYAAAAAVLAWRFTCGSPTRL